VKEPLHDDIDNDNEEDSESEEDTLVIFAMEPIVSYLGSPECNNSTDNWRRMNYQWKYRFWLFFVSW